MGIYDRDYYRDNGRRYLDSLIPEGQVCKSLIIAHVVLFVIQILNLPSGSFTLALLLQPEQVMHGEIWRLFTFSFLHDPNTFWPLLWNMLFLWWFGSDLEQMYGSREFLAFYLLSAVFGGLAFTGVAYFNGQQETAAILGPTGAITALTVLFACHFPNHTVRFFFLFPMPIWLLVILQIALAAFFARSTIVLTLAGALFGGLYYKKQWRLTSFWEGWTAWRKRSRAARSKLRLYEPEDREPEPVTVAAIKPSVPVLDEHLDAKVDAVLEKMARNGKESLTDHERQILLQASEIYRKKRS